MIMPPLARTHRAIPSSLRLRVPAVLLCMVLASISAVAARASEPIHHDIRLALNPEHGTVAVTDRITVTGRKKITLAVEPWMRMSNIRIDGEAVQDNASGATVTLTVPSLRRHRIDVAARGTIPKADEKARRRNTGSDPVAGKAGAYLPGWVQWFPRTSDPVAGYRLSIETPAAHRAVATGTLQSEQLGAETNKSVITAQTWLEPPSVFAGPYTVAERQLGKIRIRTYFHDAVASLADSYLDTAGRYIQMFEQQIGAYPYTDFHIISAPLPVGLGFPNLTYIGRRIVPLPFMRGRSLAHEVLHNWWGNGVRIDYETGNWAEGLTTYMADHALAEQRGPKMAAEMRLGWLRDFAALPEDKDIAVTRFVSKQHDASQVVGYGKIALIFHMLKDEVGDRHFETAIRQFWRENKFRTAGWSDIQTAFEATTQTDLSWFFRQWTNRAGAPRVTLEEANVSRDSEGYILKLSLAQAAPAYRLKVPVEVTTEKGIRRSHIVLDGERTTESLQVGAKPIKLRIDPDHGLFRRLLPGEAPPILRDVLLDDGAKTLVLYDQPAARKPARQLAERLFGTAPELLNLDRGQIPDTPFLVLGSADQIGRFITRFDLPARPAEIAGQGSGRAWVVRRTGGMAVLFVEADAPDALSAMMRPLPHYRSRSYVVFDGRRAVERGVWPATGGPLEKTFD